MEQPLIIQLDSAYCTVEEFSRRTGIPAGSAKKDIQQGKIPILPRKTGKERILVNMVLWFKQAASQPY